MSGREVWRARDVRRYEVVRTAAGWHARIIAMNGEPVMSSEVVKRQATARRAIEIAARGACWQVDGEWLPYVQTIEGPIEVRMVDERGDQ